MVTKRTADKVPAHEPKTSQSRRRLPVVDFSALTASDVDDLPKVSRNSKYAADSPFIKLLEESRDRQIGKAVTVDSQEEAEAVRAGIRYAAQRLGLGSRVVLEPQNNGSVRVVFAARPRRRYTPRAD